MTRHLATIRTIDSISPIKGADRIVCARIGGWPVVVGKDDYRENDSVVYFEPDAMLPLNNPAFAPLASRGRHAENSHEEPCMVLGTVRLRKQVSQGLALPLSALGIPEDTPAGTDVSAQLGIEKYDPPEVVSNNMVLRKRPSFVPVTEEERVQNLSEMLTWLAAHPDIARRYSASEKLDGTSASFYAVYTSTGKLTNYGACSRRHEVMEPDDHDTNVYWKCWDRYNIMDRLNTVKNKTLAHWPHYVDRDGGVTVVVQGEITGPKINGNRMGRKNVEFHTFNVLVNKERLDPAGNNLNPATEELGIKSVFDDICVPRPYGSTQLVGRDGQVRSMDGIIALADKRTSRINQGRLAEGIVYRYDGPTDADDTAAGMQPEWRHFKVINNAYLLKIEEKAQKKERSAAAEAVWNETDASSDELSI